MIRATMSRAAAIMFALAGLASFLVAPLAGAATLAQEDAASQPVSIPHGNGLPVVVRPALFFNHLESFDENAGTFEATVDLRLTWIDPRLRYPAKEALRGYKEYRVSAAEREIAKIWTPTIRHVNRVGDPTFSERRLRIFPNGMVEIIDRITATYKTPVETSRFPFDRQSLEIVMVVQEDTVETVDMNFTSDDVGFSRISKKAELDGWSTGLVSLKRELVNGWNGDRYAKIVASLAVNRMLGNSIATIFIPLFASLLIPFLATWMNRAQDDEFDVDAFELGNVIIGGLFAVIALSFTFSSSFPALSAGDNTVTRLLGLNYVALAFGTIITVVFYRYKLPARWFGVYVQEQAFLFLSWAFPILFIATGLAFVFVSAA
ncbi:Glycine receptor, alpha 4 subunit [Rhodospirillaceae bacterium LM-1]|nr:Glycine receptor, alpha 4 subunit [Rhodospirillaceae bacterium LM-1]